MQLTRASRAKQTRPAGAPADRVAKDDRKGYLPLSLSFDALFDMLSDAEGVVPGAVVAELDVVPAGELDVAVADDESVELVELAAGLVVDGVVDVVLEVVPGVLDVVVVDVVLVDGVADGVVVVVEVVAVSR